MLQRVSSSSNHRDILEKLAAYDPDDGIPPLGRVSQSFDRAGSGEGRRAGGRGRPPRSPEAGEGGASSTVGRGLGAY